MLMIREFISTIETMIEVKIPFSNELTVKQLAKFDDPVCRLNEICKDQSRWNDAEIEECKHQIENLYLELILSHKSEN